jgi:hypothetical protein
MKFLKFAFAGVAALAFGNAYAFHSGGVAECEGCHTMHNTAVNAANPKKIANDLASGFGVNAGKVGQGAAYLLQGNDQSSTCLNCHNAPDAAPSSYHVSTDDSKLGPGLAPVEMTPGGDFAWLKKTLTFSLRGTPTVNEGKGHGHSIVAADYGYVAEAGKTAPGGTYPADKLACSSCHDPHGKYRRFADGSIDTTGLPIFNSGSYNNSANPTASVSAVGVYRILGGVAKDGTGYLPKSLQGVAGATAFSAQAPVAVAPSTYNRSEATGQTHVAYGQGMSEWCGNCHASMVENAFQSGTPGHAHPAGNGAKLTDAIVANYNKYVSSGIMTNADATKAYSTLAPFELGTADYAVLKPLAVNTDTVDMSAKNTSNVSCLSCHRAHASAWEAGLRFSHENEFMTIADASNAAAYDPSTTEGKINRG